MAEIPDRVVRFLRDYINSVEQLEVLLLLYKNPDKEWTAKEVSQVLATHPNAAASRLIEFEARGVITYKPGTDRRYRYERREEDLHQTVRDLAEAYSTYRVRIITLIYSKPSDSIRTFADAFRLKKEDQ
jgi:hypothetical protein